MVLMYDESIGYDVDHDDTDDDKTLVMMRLNLQPITYMF